MLISTYLSLLYHENLLGLAFAIPRFHKAWNTRVQIFSLLQGSEAQRTTDLLLLRFSSHWPHPLSFNRFAFAAHAALPLFTFCLFPHGQNVRPLLFSVPVSPLQLFVPLYRHILKSLLISFITFPGSRRTFEASPLQNLHQEFPPRLSLSPSECFRALNRFDLLLRLFWVSTKKTSYDFPDLLCVLEFFLFSPIY